jgi:tetratricopeptide (TPR) repeat protein
MSKKGKKRLDRVRESETASPPAAVTSKRHLLVAALLASLVFVLYSNTLSNGYALDDGLVITENAFTMKGISGIPDILTRGGFAGVEGAWGGDLSGGRWRPLSQMTFAIEKSLFDLQLPISHLINVLLYAAVVALLFLLLQERLFPNTPAVALVASLIFAVHPVHTEVVANLKGRDEILALLFLIISLRSGFRYWGQSAISSLALSLTAFFLALLSKESAITFLAVIGLTSYVFTQADWFTSARRTLPYVAVTIAYFAVRSQIVGSATAPASTELMNNPFLLATPVEAFCTKVVILGKYLALLVFPRSLSYDYSFNQIPYADPFDWRFLIALMVNAALALFAILHIGKRQVYAFGILVYFSSISIVSNFVFGIGATMGERFLFQPSLGFAVVVGFLAYRGMRYRKTLTALLAATVVAAGWKTIARNEDWEDNFTLFSRDVGTVPNSAKANGNLAIAYNIKAQGTKDDRAKEWYEQSIVYATRATAIYPTYVDAHLTMGTAYMGLGDLASAGEQLEKARALMPASRVLDANLRALSQRYVEEAAKFGSVNQSNLDQVRQLLEKAVLYNPSNAQALFNLGGVFYALGDLSTAREYWNRTIILEPAHADAAEWLRRTAN